MNIDAIQLDALVASAHLRLVAVEPGDDGTATIYCRLPEEGVVSRTIPFQPWVLVSGPNLAGHLKNTASVIPLSGMEIHNTRVHFSDTKAYYQALKDLKTVTGANPSSPQAPYRVFSDLTQQVLALEPARLFRDMSFPELLRMQIDIETLTAEGYDFPNAERESDEIIIISMHDSTGWEKCLAGPELSEAEMLREMIRIVRERDPDVIEGHNIFNFDLPYIQTRCKRHKIKLALGRDASVAKVRSSRFTAGERTSTYQRYDIFGRHVVDTLQLVQLYDVSHRDMDSYGLKAAARYFGVAAPERTYVDGSQISRVYREDPERLRAYALDDVRETEAISRLLSPSYFCQAQLIPFSYQNCITRGTATRIDALLTSLYILGNHSLPTPQAPRTFQGGLTGSEETGIFTNVWHVDVRSLYPSIIISQRLVPRSDSLELFSQLLSELRQFRLAAKDASRNAGGRDREHYEALQTSFKILINSFYGYAGFAQGTFNDYDLAENVTAEGRRILQSMVEFLLGRGARVIEMDTDGVYFVPPAGVADTVEFLGQIQQTLPDGIEVDLDSTYAAMFGYKSKNYALLGHDGAISITGAALKSRGIEPFQRNYIRELITLLLKGKGDEAGALYERFKEDLIGHRFPLADLAKREVLSTSPATYKEKLDEGTARRSAAYELVIASGREYRQGDTVAFYVTGDRKNVSVTDASKLLADALPDERDENVSYYLDKLEKLHTKFAEFL